MSKKKPFEHEIDPELLTEIEEWEQQEHDEPEEYYFSNPDPYLEPTPLPPDHPRRNFWFDEDGHISLQKKIEFVIVMGMTVHIGHMAVAVIIKLIVL